MHLPLLLRHSEKQNITDVKTYRGVMGWHARRQASGVACHMITGDNWVTARMIAHRLGIRHVIAEVRCCSPTSRGHDVEKKVPSVREYALKHQTVRFVLPS